MPTPTIQELLNLRGQVGRDLTTEQITGITPTAPVAAPAQTPIQIAQQTGQGQFAPDVIAPTPAATLEDPLTIGEQFDVPFNLDVSRDVRGARDLVGRTLFEQAQGKDIVDPVAIRREAVQQMQDRIDAINQVFDVQLTEARRVAQGRVGEGTAILAARGLGGSPRGAAIREGVTERNRQIEGAIQAERNVAVQTVLTEANDFANKEAQRRREAQQAGGRAFLDFIKGEEERSQKGLNTLTTAFLSQGIDPTGLNDQELQTIAQNFGVTTQNIFAAFQQAKSQQDIESAEAERKALQSGDPAIERFTFAQQQGFEGTFLDFQEREKNLVKTAAQKNIAAGLTSTGRTPTAEETATVEALQSGGSGDQDFGDAIEGDFVFGQGFLTPDGTFEDINATPTQKRDLRDAKVSGFNTAVYFLNTPNKFREEFIRDAAKTGAKPRFGFSQVDDAYTKWLEAQDGGGTTTTTTSESTVEDL